MAKILSFLLLSQLMIVNGLIVPRDNDYTMNQKGIKWDSSCTKPNPKDTSETRKAAVERAWAGALELSYHAWERFEGITAPMLTGHALSKSEQETIEKKDPAYVQMFALDWSKATKKRVLGLLRRFASRANANPGEHDRPESILSIYCDDQFNECENDHEIASTSNVPDPDDETEYRDVDMTFCPKFWNLLRYDRLKLATQVDEPFEKDVTAKEFFMVRGTIWSDEEYDGTDAASVAHELSHVWWLGPTNEDPKTGCNIPETYELHECAKLAWNKGKPKANNLDITWNADTYAFYMEYGRFVELLGKDPWRETLKPVKLPVTYE